MKVDTGARDCVPPVPVRPPAAHAVRSLPDRLKRLWLNPGNLGFVLYMQKYSRRIAIART